MNINGSYISTMYMLLQGVRLGYMLEYDGRCMSRAFIKPVSSAFTQ